MLPPKKALVHHTGVLGFPLLVLVSCFATHPILCQALLSFGPSILLIWYSCRHFECKHKDATDAQNAQRLSFLLRHLVAYRVCEIKGNNFRSPWPIRSVSFSMAYWPRGQDLDSLSAVLSLTQPKDFNPLLCPTITLLLPVAAAFDKDPMDSSLICCISPEAGSVESGSVKLCLLYLDNTAEVPMCLAQMHWFHTLHCYRRPQTSIIGLFPYLLLLQLNGKSIVTSHRFLDASKVESHDYNVLRYFSSSGVKSWHCTDDCKFVCDCVPFPNTFP